MLSSVLASSAVALAALLIAAPAHVDALVTPPGSGSQLGHLAARHLAGVSPNHHALARRKRNVHKNRKRCQQRPASTSTSTPAPQPTNGNNNPPYTPPPANNGNGKLLLAWPNGGDVGSNSKYFTGKASRYYTWSPDKVEQDNNLPFCAMLWGDNQADHFRDKVIPGYTDCILGMNEPNQQGQSDMDTDHGAWLWNSLIAPLAYQGSGYSIFGSPAPTSAPDGLVWITEWLPKVQVKPNVMCLHWYDVGLAKFQEYVTNYHNHVQMTIWITEFACQNFNGGAQCDQGQVWEFVQQSAAWMDSTDWIGMYAPFGFMKQMQGVNELNQLMSPWDGAPTDLGYWVLHSS